MKVRQIEKNENTFQIDPVKLRVARAIKGWTLTELEEKSGVQRKTISKIEKNLCKTIKIDTFNKIIKALEQDPSFFMKNEN